MRLIDADALCADLQNRIGSPEGDEKLMKINFCITHAPTINAEPRVLTLEEIEASDVVWVEEHNTVIAAVYAVFSSTPNFWDFHTKQGTWSMAVREYGRTWRCWSYKPTDEQRKAVKWSD